MKLPSISTDITDRRQAFTHALQALCHPTAIAAMALVLLNDHLLRHSWPSWLTGKIGDFAWLVFAPIVLAALLVWLLPKRLAADFQKLGWLAFALVVLVFILAKTVPFFHALTLQAYEFVIQWPSTLRLDPGDLVALPALVLGWRIWTGAQPKARRMPASAGVMLSLAVFATLADAPAPNLGVSCLLEKEGVLYATVSYNQLYFSQDYGYTWQPVDGSGFVECQTHSAAWEISDPGIVPTLYRLTPGVSIEKSSDNGATWQMEVDLRGEQARVVFQDKRYNNGYGVLQPGPLDALFETATHNLVVAMGHQGILLGTPDGKWQWVAVDAYYRSQPASLGDFLFLMQAELWLSLVLVFLLIGSFYWRIRKREIKKFSNWLLGFVLLAGWAAWIFSAIVQEPAVTNNYGYASAFVLAPLLLAALFGAPLAIAAIIELTRFSPPALWKLLGIAVGGALLYLLPLFVWAAGGLARYRTASIFASVFVAAVLLAGHLYLSRLLRGVRPLEEPLSPPQADLP